MILEANNAAKLTCDGWEINAVYVVAPGGEALPWERRRPQALSIARATLAHLVKEGARFGDLPDGTSWASVVYALFENVRHRDEHCALQLLAMHVEAVHHEFTWDEVLP